MTNNMHGRIEELYFSAAHISSHFFKNKQNKIHLNKFLFAPFIEKIYYYKYKQIFDARYIYLQKDEKIPFVLNSS